MIFKEINSYFPTRKLVYTHHKVLQQTFLEIKSNFKRAFCLAVTQLVSGNAFVIIMIV